MSHREGLVRLLSVESVTVLDLEGEIDVHTAPAFRDALLQAIDEGARRIVVDAAKVTFMDSTGLGVLVCGERRLPPLGGSLAVACAGRIGRLLEMTGLHDVFTLFASREEALRGAQGGRDAAAVPPHPPEHVRKAVLVTQDSVDPTNAEACQHGTTKALAGADAAPRASRRVRRPGSLQVAH